MKKIKMRENLNKNSVCSICGMKWKNALAMYDFVLNDDQYHLCNDCCNIIEHKMLKANCLYNGKIKSSEDMERVRRYKAIKNKLLGINTDEKIG